MENFKGILLVLLGGLAALFALYSLANSIVHNPVVFLVIFGIGGALIAYLMFKKQGDWNPNSENFPPYKMIVIILIVCLVISWVFTSGSNELMNCPAGVSRWC